jgi:hypothetical protein
MFDELEAIVMNAPPPARGRAAKTIAWGAVRELTDEDILALHSPMAAPVRQAPLRELRYRHHLVARLLAEGKSNTQISESIGMSVARISTLKQDPAFSELVEEYKEKIDEVYFDAHARLAALGITAVEELQARLDDSADRFTAEELRKIAESSLDRSIAPNKSGFGPGNAGPRTSINISFVKADGVNEEKIRQVDTESAPLLEGTATEVEE